MIIDTGPLVTLLVEREARFYGACSAVFESRRENFVTTTPCLTEVMHLIGNWHYQSKLWDWIAEKSVNVYELSENDMSRMQVLMERYHDTPMDFADASLVAVAEKLNTNRIFTLDSDFSVYRINGTTSFEIIP